MMKSPTTRLYKKYYAVKEWNRFSIHLQEWFCYRFDVILTDHQTKGEKARGFLKKLNAKNLNTGINKFQKGLDDFDKLMKQTKGITGPQKDLSGLLGKPKKGFKL